MKLLDLLRIYFSIVFFSSQLGRFFHFFSNPVSKFRDSCINSRESWFGTAISKWNNSYLKPSKLSYATSVSVWSKSCHQWSSRIALTKIKSYFNLSVQLDCNIQCGSFVWNSPMLSFFHVKIWTKRLCSSFLQPKNYWKMISYHAKVTWPLFDECLKIKLRYFP